MIGTMIIAFVAGVWFGFAIVCNNCGVSVHLVEADCAEENIKAWNRRANDEKGL